MSRRLTWDRYLFASASLIVIVGLVMIYSASAIIAQQKFEEASPYYFLARQLVFLVIGAVAMLLAMHVDMQRLRDSRVIALLAAITILTLVAVLFQAPVNGTHRWFVLPWFHIQPSELAKPVVVIGVAWFLSRREGRINEFSSTLVPLGVVLAFAAGLILLQPDFGTAATIVLVSAAMVLVAGLSWTRVLAFTAVLVPAAIALIFSAEYRRDRLLTFLDPEADPLGKGFQAMQSLIAIGTGGVTGLGIGNGRQKLFFLPEPHTDFIFAIIGEELGLLGALLLITAYGFLIWRGLRIAWRATDRFVFYAATGLTLMLGLQALLNISVAVSLLPTKGLPLPLVSYGGSSLIASLIAVGMLLNFSQHTN